MTLKQKYKVQRKCREHDRQMKKLAKANPDLIRRKKKEDPGIPNLWPFKEAMLRDAENAKIAEQEIKERERQVKKALKEREKVRSEQIEKARLSEYQRENTVEGKRKWYFRELMKVVEASDVILQVLDARDPLGCRAFDIERKIAGMLNEQGYPTKKVVLVLNKIDMVPSEVVQNWVTYLRREYPTIAFKASTHKHRGHLNRMEVKSHKASQKVLDTKASVGATALLQLLKNYCRSRDLKKGLTVGIIGYPNVGKSSVVNSLKMTRAVQVSAAAGCTKALQQVRLDANIMLIDSPGVLFSADEDNTNGEEAQRNLLLRNVLRVDQVEDPINAIQGILERCTKEQLMGIYNIADFKNTAEFLLFVAHRRGKMNKGGVPNLEEAARCVLQDWNEGKIPFYTLPPVSNDVTESNVVSSWGAEFDINALLDEANNQTVKVIRENNITTYGKMDGDDEVDFDEMDMEEDEDMFDDEDEEVVSVPATATMGSFVVEESDEEEEMDDSAPAAPAPNRMHPKELEPLRNAKVGRSKASKVLEKAYGGAVAPAKTKAQLKQEAKKAKKRQTMEDDDDYDFNDYM